MQAAPIIDGHVASDPAWAMIPREDVFLTSFVEEFDAHFPAYKQSSFKIGYTSSHLHLGVTCLEPWTRYLSTSAVSDSSFRKDDGVEFLLAPGPDSGIFHFVVNANGSRWSWRTDTVEELPLEDWEAASRIEEDSYTVEIRIPFEKIGLGASGGDVWTGNIVRNTVTINSPEDRRTSWSGVSDSFEDPAEFGALKFEAGFPTPTAIRNAEMRLGRHADDLLQLEHEIMHRIQEREDERARAYRQHVESTGYGFTGITRGPADLVAPPDSPADEVWRYGLGFPLQVSPTQAVLLTNVRMEGTGNIDFEIGTDAVLFDDLDAIDADNAIPVSRFERIHDPVEGELIVRKGPVIAGFVPLGALLEDGSPHPHAGTGFGICWGISHRVDEDGGFDYLEYVERYAILFQFAFDGERFLVEDRKRIDASTILPDWNLVGNFVTNGIPDGRDILYVMIARVDDVAVAGYTRWRREEGFWRPVDFTPVTGYDVTWSEPSLVRDGAGNLYMSARPYDRADPVITFDLAVWGSTDNGNSWSRVVYEKNRRARSPVSINRTADGTPFLAANTPALRRTREILSIWPLNESRSGLEGRITARDARIEFGPAPSGSWWRIDHPNSAVVRMADGEWHGVLSYRIVDNGEVEGDARPAPQTGCYVEEVFSAGPPVPPWHFGETL
jgi:hypothetical protein